MEHFNDVTLLKRMVCNRQLIYLWVLLVFIIVAVLLVLQQTSQSRTVSADFHTTTALRQGNIFAKPSPNRPRVIQTAAGGNATCVLLNYEQVKCFGNAEFGQLGAESSDNVGDNLNEMGNYLHIVDLNFTSVRHISVGARHACAVSLEGDLKCWGDGSHGELGLGLGAIRLGHDTAEMGASLPKVEFKQGEFVSSVSAGDGFTCALFREGYVKCFGNGRNGRLGQGSTNSVGLAFNTTSSDFRRIDFGGYQHFVRQLSSGGGHACVVLSDRSARCWGAGFCGQLGSKSREDLGDEDDEMGSKLPPIDLGNNRSALSISAGGNHTCVLLDNLSVKCFGCNNFGQLGLTRKVSEQAVLQMGDSLPTLDLGPNRTARLIKAGERMSCAVLDDNSLRCWGDETIHITRPTADVLKGNETIEDVTIGSHHICILYSEADNQFADIVCMGRGSQGQLGSESTDTVAVADAISEDDFTQPVNLGLTSGTVDSDRLFYETSYQGNSSVYCRNLETGYKYSWTSCRQVSVNISALVLQSKISVQFNLDGRSELFIAVDRRESTNENMYASVVTEANWEEMMAKPIVVVGQTIVVRLQGDFSGRSYPVMVNYGLGVKFQTRMYRGLWTLSPCNMSSKIEDVSQLACHVWHSCAPEAYEQFYSC